MRYSIEQKTLENLLNYVITKPYNEVAQLIAEVQKDIKPVVEEEPDVAAKYPEQDVV